VPIEHVSLADVESARNRIARFLTPTPLRNYPTLDAHVGGGTRVLVKHENHQPTQAFKIRNGLSAITALDEAARTRGVIGASTGNHGQGLAYAGHLLGVAVTICVPVGNNPEKNAAIRGWGAGLVEQGENYDESISVATSLASERGLTLVHSTNDRDVLAGAGTLTLEILEQASDLDALILAVGGGSQAAGAVTVTKAIRPDVGVYAVQAAGASTAHDSWHARTRLPPGTAATFAEGMATRATYDFTFPTLLDGLAGFVTVTDDELLAAMKLLWTHTHNLAEGAGAAGLAALLGMRDRFEGRTVGIVISGGNCDAPTARRALGAR